MELGDRVYAAERITKKREKRVSIASTASRWRYQAESVRAPLPPLHLSLLLLRTSYLFFFLFFLSFADSRLRAAAASSMSLTVRDISDIIRQQIQALPCYLVHNAVHIVNRSSSIHRFCHRRSIRSVNEIAIPRPVTLRHDDERNNNGVCVSLFRNVLRYFERKMKAARRETGSKM